MSIFDQLLAVERALRLNQQERQRQMEIGTGGGGALVDTHSPKPQTRTSKVESVGLKLVELEKQRQRYEHQYVRLTHAAEALISRIEKPKHRQVLELRYLCGMPWAKVTEAMNYTEPKTAYRVHGLALHEIEAHTSCFDPSTKLGGAGEYQPQ